MLINYYLVYWYVWIILVIFYLGDRVIYFVNSCRVLINVSIRLNIILNNLWKNNILYILIDYILFLYRYYWKGGNNLIVF